MRGVVRAARGQPIALFLPKRRPLSPHRTQGQQGEPILRALDLEHLGHGMTASRRGLPVNFVKAVTGDVFAQLLEIASLADLPLGVQAAIGQGLGVLLFLLAGSRRRIALRNLELCFPQWSAAQRRSRWSTEPWSPSQR